MGDHGIALMRTDFLVTTALPEPGMTLLREAGSVLLPDSPLTPSDLSEACRSGEFRVVVVNIRDRFRLRHSSNIARITNGKSPAGFRHFSAYWYFWRRR